MIVISKINATRTITGCLHQLYDLNEEEFFSDYSTSSLLSWLIGDRISFSTLTRFEMFCKFINITLFVCTFLKMPLMVLKYSGYTYFLCIKCLISHENTITGIRSIGIALVKSHHTYALMTRFTKFLATWRHFFVSLGTN